MMGVPYAAQDDDLGNRMASKTSHILGLKCSHTSIGSVSLFPSSPLNRQLIWQYQRRVWSTRLQATGSPYVDPASEAHVVAVWIYITFVIERKWIHLFIASKRKTSYAHLTHSVLRGMSAFLLLAWTPPSAIHHHPISL